MKRTNQSANLLEFWVLWSKFTKFLSFLRQQIDFSLNFASLSVSWDTIPLYFRDAKFKENLSRGFKYDMRNLVNFHPTTQKSETSISCFCPKYVRFELKKCRGVVFHDTKLWWKIWIKPDLAISKMAWAIGWTFIRALKSQKNCTLMDSFCPNHIMFRLEHFRGTMFHDTEE